MIGDLLKNPQEFADFEFLGFWQTRYNDVVAVCIFFAWIKIFKYISFNKTMTQLSSTLSRVRPNPQATKSYVFYSRNFEIWKYHQSP